METPSRENPLSVGTLSYTKLGLLSVFFWMLWGDLCVSIMEQVVPRLVPLQLSNLGAAKWSIGLVSASIPAGVEFLFTPVISTFSDRFRSRWGRRRPFILCCTPILALCLILVGFAAPLAERYGHLASGPGLRPTTVAIITLGVLLAVFQIFNVVVLATYYYMIADVVPRRVIGTFTCLYKVAGALGAMVFNKWVFPHADSHMPGIYVGCAAVYFAAFMLMGWRVKEGEYPPPTPSAGSRDPLATGVRWLEESFSIRFYQKLYLIGLFYYFMIGSWLFFQFFALDDLHMTKEQFGNANFYAGLCSLPLFFVLGPISDRFHPLRVLAVGIGLMCLTGLAGQLFIRGPQTFFALNIANTLAQTVYLGSQISLLPRLFPREQYGQYCSANNTLCALGKFLAPALSGALIGTLANNRLAFLWQSIFAAGGVIACIAVLCHWKSLGGDSGYQPPRLARRDKLGFEVVAPAVISTESELALPSAGPVDPPAISPADRSPTPPP